MSQTIYGLWSKWANSSCDFWLASTSSTSASLYPVSPPDNTFALPTEVFSSTSCLAIVSAVTVGGLFLWPTLRYGTGYQTVWETRPSAETPSDVHWRRFYFQLTCVHSALELSGRCALQIYLLTYLMLPFLFPLIPSFPFATQQPPHIQQASGGAPLLPQWDSGCCSGLCNLVSISKKRKITGLQSAPTGQFPYIC